MPFPLFMTYLEVRVILQHNHHNNKSHDKYPFIKYEGYRIVDIARACKSRKV